MNDAAPVAYLPDWVRAVLRCPACHAELADAEPGGAPELACTDEACARIYPVERVEATDGGPPHWIPVLLVDEARGGPAAER